MKKFKLMLLSLAATVLLGSASVAAIGGEYVNEDEYTILEEEEVQPETYFDEEGEIQVKEKALLEEELEKSLVEEQKLALENIPEMEFEKETYNILLIGVDRRDDTWYGNSDVMLLVTVNDYTETIYLTSFMRDMYSNIPEVGVRKLNAACAYGGPLLCVETIKNNYGVDIDNWAMVDFDSMRVIMDELGGVDVELTEAEIDYVNRGSGYMYKRNNLEPKTLAYTEDGYVHLDGCQAVTHARNRSVGSDSDFGRTQRQRDVLSAMIYKLGDMDTDTVTNLVTDVLPYLSHDISTTRLVSILFKAPTWSYYNIEQLRLPFDDMWYSENEILIPTDMGATIDRLRSTIYQQ